MKKLKDGLYFDTVYFGPYYGFRRKEILERELESARIKEMLEQNLLKGESWFTKPYRSEELDKGGISRISTVDPSRAIINIKSLQFFKSETNDACGVNVTFETCGPAKDFIDKEIMELNYNLHPRTIITKYNGIVDNIKLVTFDIIGGDSKRI